MQTWNEQSIQFPLIPIIHFKILAKLRILTHNNRYDVNFR